MSVIKNNKAYGIKVKIEEIQPNPFPEYLTVGYKVINNPDTFQIISNTDYISGWRYKGETEWRTPVAEITVNDYYGIINIEFNLVDNTKISDSMFREISGSRITEVELPASVTTIEDGAFFKCGYMGMPNLQNVTSIGDDTFYSVGVFEKSDYILNNSVDYSGWKVKCFNANFKVWWNKLNAPYNCYVNGDVYNVRVDSQDIDLTNGINGLPIYRFRAFILNTSLNSIKFPATLTSIVDSAFNEATITDLYFYGTTPPVSELYDDGNIWKGSNITNIYVPSAALTAYQNSPAFADVASIIQGM